MKKRTIGIFGLTGDPFQAGHAYCGEVALAELGLDEVWFSLSPQSTAKVGQEKAAIEHRLHLAHLDLRKSGGYGTTLKVTDFEVSLYTLTGKNNTADVLEHFTSMYPSLQPVWLMGADNLCQIHTWGSRWEEIMLRYPVGVLARDRWNNEALDSVAAKQFAHGKREPNEFRALPGTWSMIDVDYSASSTKVREQLRAGKRPDHISLEAYEYIRAQGLYGTSNTVQ